ncbi:hypothetical protein XELAEV_18030572mg [Xenopus laevis]|uniref:Secreted protein n=1 Tax=Xenopus laevis TaxID=8355 RepID=A0A974HF72_XENLA|nr:hypothetical protein XELAEV_18030572mg [Xenopus laevis]
MMYVLGFLSLAALIVLQNGRRDLPYSCLFCNFTNVITSVWFLFRRSLVRNAKLLLIKGTVGYNTQKP